MVNKKMIRPHCILASFKGHTKIVELLIKNGANMNIADKDGYTPLHMASRNGHLDTTRLLLENGADLKNLDMNYHFPPMHSSLDDEFEIEFEVVTRKIATPMH